MYVNITNDMSNDEIYDICKNNICFTERHNISILTYGCLIKTSQNVNNDIEIKYGHILSRNTYDMILYTNYNIFVYTYLFKNVNRLN